MRLQWEYGSVRVMSGPEVLKEFRALPAEERRRVAEVILTDDDSWIPESFQQGMEDIAAGRVMDMEIVMRKEPPSNPETS